MQDLGEQEPGTVAERVRRWPSASISGILSLLSGAAVLVIMLITVVDVSSRQLIGSSVAGAVEYGELLLVALVFLGIAQAERTEAHVAMTIVTQKVRPRIAAGMRTFGYCVALVVILWMLWETSASALDSWSTGEYRFGLRRVSIWPARALIPVGLFLLSYEMIKRIITDMKILLRAGRTPDKTL